MPEKGRGSEDYGTNKEDLYCEIVDNVSQREAIDSMNRRGTG